MKSSLGASIRAARKAAGLSIPALAELTGMTTAQISQVETGKRKDPRLSTLVRIAAALRLTLDDLLGQTGLIEEHRRKLPGFPKGGRSPNALRQALKGTRTEANRIDGAAKRILRHVKAALHEMEMAKG